MTLDDNGEKGGGGILLSWYTIKVPFDDIYYDFY